MKDKKQEQIYFLDDYISDEKHAGSKARLDAREIFLRRGYKGVSVNRHPERNIFSKMCFYISVISTLNRIPRKSILILQFPLYYLYKINIFLPYIISIRQWRTVVFIHDIDFLRSDVKYGFRVKLYYRVLLKSCVVISHNLKMTHILLDMGISTNKVLNLEIFDYLMKKDDIPPRTKRREVCFAGNLGKSQFCKRLNELNLKHTVLRLYGVAEEPNSFVSHNIEYAGCFPSDEIPYRLVGSYSLVWDGDSLETCSGVFGNYLRYNNPHKVSLSIVSRLPVIIWEDAAMADFVKKEGIGFTVRSLFELEEKVNSITDEQYSDFQRNLDRVSVMLKNGFYLNRMLDDSEKIVCYR